MENDVTIDDLAAMTQKGFTEVYERMEAGFKEVHEKMAIMATKEDLLDLEERLSYRWGCELDIVRDDMRMVKTKLGIR